MTVRFNQIVQPFTINWLARVVVLGLVLGPIGSAALEIKEQFYSTNAAVILGLDKDADLAKPDAVLTKEKVRSAFRKLLMEYHPDKFAKASEDDQKNAGFITRKINEAAEYLNKHLTQNPNPTQSEEHTWSDVFRESGAESRPRGQNFSESSLEGTHFEFLSLYSGFEKAYMPLDGWSVERNARLDAIMIIDPAIFPEIEILYILKDQKGLSPKIIDTQRAKYTRGHHRAAARPIDAIVLPSGNYFIIIGTYFGGLDLTATPFDDSGKHLVVNPSPQEVPFMELGPSGYNAGVGRIFALSKKRAEDFLPKVSAVANWRDVEIVEPPIIYLGSPDCSSSLSGDLE